MDKPKGSQRMFSWLSQLLPGFNTPLGTKQTIETGHALPILILFHFCAAIGISNLVNSEVPQVMLRGWQFAVVLAAMPLLFFA